MLLPELMLTLTGAMEDGVDGVGEDLGAGHITPDITGSARGPPMPNPNLKLDPMLILNTGVVGDGVDGELGEVGRTTLDTPDTT